MLLRRVMLEKQSMQMPMHDMERDIDIINGIYPFVSTLNTIIVTSTRPRIEGKYPLVKVLYIDVDILSWSELEYMVSALPNLSYVIIRVNSLIGGIAKLTKIINDRKFILFAVLVNGDHCDNIVNPTEFLQKWAESIPPESFHIYYQSKGSLPKTGKWNTSQSDHFVFITT